MPHNLTPLPAAHAQAATHWACSKCSGVTPIGTPLPLPCAGDDAAGEGWVTKDSVKDIVKETVKETLKSVSSATSESDSKSTGSKRSHGSDAGHYSGKRRDTKRQAEMSAAVMKRDGKCLVTGSGLEHALDCAHIVGLENIESFPRDMHYAPSMGFALRKDLHPSYDRHEWYFKPDGSVVKLRPNTVELPKNIAVPAELDKTAMGVKETLALASADGRCSYCWKKVGMVNMTEHRKRSCSDPTLAKGPKPTDLVKCGVCDVEIAFYNLESHNKGQKHLKAVASKGTS